MTALVLTLLCDIRVVDDWGTDAREGQSGPRVAVSGSGDWLVTWQDGRAYTTNAEIFCRGYAPSQAPWGSSDTLSFPTLWTDDDAWQWDGPAGGVADTFLAVYEDDPSEGAARFYSNTGGPPAFYTADSNDVGGSGYGYARGGRGGSGADRWGAATLTGYVAAWTFEDHPSGIRRNQAWYKRYDRSGALVDSGRVDTTGNLVSGPGGPSLNAVAVNEGGGRFAVLWQTVAGNLFARVFDGTTVPATPVAAVHVNSDVPGSAVRAGGVACDAAGNFLVVWADNRSGGRHVYARLIDPDGSPLTAPFLVSTGVTDAVSPDVARDSLGCTVVVWADSLPSLGNWHVFKRDYTPALVAGPITRVDGAPDGVAAQTPSVAENEAYDQFIVWKDERNAATNGADVYGLFTVNGQCATGVGENERRPARGATLRVALRALSISVPAPSRVEIYDAGGRLVRALTVTKSARVALARGVYLVRVGSKRATAVAIP